MAEILYGVYVGVDVDVEYQNEKKNGSVIRSQ